MARLLLWFKETRPQFLFLSVVLTFLGTTIAWYYGSFNLGYALLAGSNQDSLRCAFGSRVPVLRQNSRSLSILQPV